jgi:hypothetical protein
MRKAVIIMLCLVMASTLVTANRKKQLKKKIRNEVKNEIRKDIADERGLLLGEKIVDFGAEKDVIVVTRKEGRFRKLLIEVEGNNLEIYRMVVDYTPPGGKEKIPLKLFFKEGDASRFIDLRGEARAIRKITFWYRTVGKIRKGKATVKVYGI